MRARMVTKSRFPLPPIIPSVIMALKVAAVLLCMAAFAIPSTQGKAGLTIHLGTFGVKTASTDGV